MAGDLDRLEGWKQIAAFLNKDLRTVQRWERAEGLPVHRHQHRAQGSVFAYPAELTEWARHRTTRPARPLAAAGALASREEPAALLTATLPAEEPAAPAPEPLPAAPPPAAATRPRRTLALAAAGLALLAAAGFVLQQRAQARFSTFRQGDLALVGQVRNETGNPLLDGTLPYVLAGELQRSGWVTVLPRERVREALAAMGRPATAELDAPALAGIRQRNPEVRVLVTGEARKGPAGYLLRVRLEDPASRRTLESPAIPAAHEGEVPAAMHRLADWTRHALGDQRPGEGDRDTAPRASTASPAAARLYSRAVALRLQGTPEEASVQERLLREALREDPEFATAWHELSLAVRRQGRPKSEWLPHLEKAHSLAAKASVEERLQIEADAAMIRRDYGEAIAARRAYLQLNPDSADAHRKLILAYEWTGRYEEALSLALNHVTRQPENRVANYIAGLGLANWAGDVARARRFADKAAALGASATRSAQPGYVWADHFPLFQLWAEGQYPALRRAVAERAAGELPEPGPRRENSLRFLGMFAAGLGRFDDANALFARLTPERREAAVAMLRFLRGESVPAFSGRHVYPDAGITAVLLARGGQLTGARAARAALESVQASDGDLMAVDGEILAAAGDTAAAITQLEEAQRRLRLSGSPLYYLAAERLATLLAAEGRAGAAIAALTEPAAARARAYNESGPGGAFWARDCRLLAALYRRQGRPREAAALESALRPAQLIAD